MTRLGLFLLALAVSVTLMLLAATGALKIACHIPLANPPRWLRAVLISISGITGPLIAIALIGRRRKDTKEEDRMTPIMRRDPQTGLRQL